MVNARLLIGKEFVWGKKRFTFEQLLRESLLLSSLLLAWLILQIKFWIALDFALTCLMPKRALILTD